MQTTTLTAPPHALQIVMSRLNTRFKRAAHVIAPRFSPFVRSDFSAGLLSLA